MLESAVRSNVRFQRDYLIFYNRLLKESRHLYQYMSHNTITTTHEPEIERNQPSRLKNLFVDSQISRAYESARIRVNPMTTALQLTVQYNINLLVFVPQCWDVSTIWLSMIIWMIVEYNTNQTREHEIGMRNTKMFLEHKRCCVGPRGIFNWQMCVTNLTTRIFAHTTTVTVANVDGSKLPFLCMRTAVLGTFSDMHYTRRASLSNVLIGCKMGNLWGFGNFSISQPIINVRQAYE